MVLTFVTDGTWEEVLFRQVPRIRETDVLVLSGSIVGKVDLVAETEGRETSVRQLCLLSEQKDCVLLAGCDTEVCGILHKSCIVIDGGELLGISDMVNVIDETVYAAGGGYRVFDTSKGKLGVIVGEDLYFPDVAKLLSLCEADVIVCVFGKITSSLPEVMARGSAYANGVDICVAGEGSLLIADIKGELCFSSNERIRSAELRPVKDYHLLTTRKRGCYRDIRSSWDVEP